MATELIPPVPNTEFKSPDNVRTWWDWFRKMRTNINTFATNITSIIAQITAVNVSSSANVTGASWTGVNTYSTGTNGSVSITTSGSPVSIFGSVGVSARVTTGAAAALQLTCTLYRDTTPLQTFAAGFNPIANLGAGSLWVGQNFAVSYLNTSLVAGTYTYKILASMQSYDNTGALLNTNGNLDFNYYLVIKELKT